MYTVKDVARMLDLSEHTVRYYTDKGLVPNLQRDEHNNRLFDDRSLSWLLAVKFLRHGNMTIEDIKTYIDLCLLGESTITERYNIISRQREMALRQLEEAKERVEYMEQKAQHYLDYMNGKVSKEIYPEQWLHDNWGV
ncbi:MAG TPA: MerR family transcriptional regulator [Virgibacillus sp.]|nr:MerR family transcriptional regulator [Virgibacillus sp.]